MEKGVETKENRYTDIDIILSIYYKTCCTEVCKEEEDEIKLDEIEGQRQRKKEKKNRRVYTQT